MFFQFCQRAAAAAAAAAASGELINPSPPPAAADAPAPAAPAQLMLLLLLPLLLLLLLLLPLHFAPSRQNTPTHSRLRMKLSSTVDSPPLPPFRNFMDSGHAHAPPLPPQVQVPLAVDIDGVEV